MADPQTTFTNNYNQLLGAFIQQFSHMEVAFFFLLCKVANIDPTLGQALFSGSRLEALISQIRRCYEALGESIDPDLERVLQQAAVLNGARNDVVHLVPAWEIEEPRVIEITLTNRIRYLPAKAKDIVIRISDLRNMVRDARDIEGFLVTQAYDWFENDDPQQWGLPKTWRYKPPGQASKGRRTPKSGRKPKPPPQSSLE